MFFRCFLIALFLLAQNKVLAQIPSVDSNLLGVGGSEFFVGKNLGKPLVTVSLINGVQKPGVYHIPVQTDLAQLLSYAGGALVTSDLEGVTIRRNQLGKNKLVKVDLETLLKSTSSIPQLQHEDVIHIEQNRTASQTMTWLTIISSVATIALTFVLIDNNSN